MYSPVQYKLDVRCVMYGCGTLPCCVFCVYALPWLSAGAVYIYMSGANSQLQLLEITPRNSIYIRSDVNFFFKQLRTAQR